MNLPPFGDLFANRRLQASAARLSEALRIKGEELSSGQASDKHAATGGDMRRLHALESAIARLDGRRSSVSLAAGRFDAAQAALGNIRSSLESSSIELLAATRRGDRAAADAFAASARGAFEAAVSALNASHAGRNLFSGAAVDERALIDAESILNAVFAATGPTTNANDAVAAAEDYFLSAGAGFETNAYRGATADAPATEIAEGEQVALAFRADDPAARRTLLSLALAVVASEERFAGGETQKLALYEISAQRRLDAASEIGAVGSSLGSAQERMAVVEARNAAEKHGLETARGSMLSKDPYEAATEFQALGAQLDALFMTTARISRLSLTNHLR